MYSFSSYSCWCAVGQNSLLCPPRGSSLVTYLNKSKSWRLVAGADSVFQIIDNITGPVYYDIMTGITTSHHLPLRISVVH